MKELWFDLAEKDGRVGRIGFGAKHSYIIGFAGRNIEKTMEHIRELEAIGVPAPASIPTIYACSPAMLSQDPSVSIIGAESSGEVEFILVKHQGRIYVGIGSDHTDRGMESYSVSKSKGVCEKPIGAVLWKYEDVQDHWDDLEMRSWQIERDGDAEKLYQEGTAGAILPLEKLMEAAEGYDADIGDSVIFSGTVPLVGGMVYGRRFRAEINDRKLNRKLELSYVVDVLPNN